MTFQEAACLGREDGKLQKGKSKDYMKFDFQFPTKQHWNAYMIAFYRSCEGYGISNRSARKSQS